MAERLSFDTTYLIDAQQELRKPAPLRWPLKRPALDFLRTRPDCIFCISVIAVGEFVEGFPDQADPRLVRILQSSRILPVDTQVALLYAQQARRLRRSGQLIGSNDLWIAATAMRHEIPLVTRNTEHYRRVQGLNVITY